MDEMKTDLLAAWELVRQVDYLIRWAVAVVRACGEDHPAIVSAMVGVMADVWATDMTAGGVDAIRARIGAHAKTVGRGVPAPALESSADAALNVFWVDRARALADEPRDVAERATKRNLSAEIWLAFITLLVAVASAYAALYEADPAWGTTGDMLAALTWSITVGAAVQVARHFAVRAT
jgi:hypothetical protein